jgi:hypothetical protein
VLAPSLRPLLVGLGQPGDHGVEVFAQPADEGVQRGEVTGLDRVHPVVQVGAPPSREQFGEGADMLGQDRQVWQTVSRSFR